MMVGIAYPNEPSASETFIRAHIENLPGEKVLLTGGYFPTIAAGKLLMVPLLRFVHRHQRHLPFSGYVQEIPTRVLSQFLKARKIDVVLAEYGVTASEITEACQRARVPLVAHFHGFDAYQHHVLEAKSNYR